MCEAFNRIIQVVLTLNNSSTSKIMNQFSCLCSIFCCVNKFCFSSSRNFHLCCLVYIAIRMSCNGNRFFPGFNIWLNSFYNDWSTKYCSIQHCTNGTVWTLPHFLQVIFGHTGSIWSNGSTLNSYTIFFCGICRINRYLIIGTITLLKS